ncbi:hypothetical protein [Yunchengibacter salinarum]|uniref:hypothetical protein n=1 Tax=Yunchengibacter salinarum TaxID=3133399 RepID=UPI0035B63EF8
MTMATDFPSFGWRHALRAAIRLSAIGRVRVAMRDQALRRLVPLRPLRRRGRLFMDVRIAGADEGLERGAVVARLRYYDRLMRLLPGGIQRVELFAEPPDHALGQPPQRLWIDPPAEAVWVVVSLRARGVPVAVEADLAPQPERRAGHEKVSVAAALAARDRLLLDKALSQCEAARDLDGARALLAHACLLWRRPADRRALMHLDDARAWAAAGFRLLGAVPGGTSGDVSGGGAAPWAAPDSHGGAVTVSVPLPDQDVAPRKWLTLMAGQVGVRLGARQRYHVGGGPNFMADVIVATHLAEQAGGRVLVDRLPAGPVALDRWLVFPGARAFLDALDPALAATLVLPPQS